METKSRGAHPKPSVAKRDSRSVRKVSFAKRVNSETRSLFVPATTIFRLLPIIRHIFFVIVSSIEKRNALKPFEFPLLRVPSEYRLIRHKACRSNCKGKEDGTVLKEATELQMPANSLLRVEGDSRGTKIVCRSGSCWDHPGGGFEGSSPGERAGFYCPSGRSHRGASLDRYGDRCKFRKRKIFRLFTEHP